MNMDMHMAKKDLDLTITVQLYIPRYLMCGRSYKL